MGRKIPGKKHRGVKDPRKQQLERREKLKQLINCPPSNPNTQEIPKTVLEINRLRELVKTGKFNKKRKLKNKVIVEQKLSNGYSQLVGSNQNGKLWPSIQQKADESDRNYLQRIYSATDEIINEAKIEVKHDVEVKQDVAEKVKNIKPDKAKACSEISFSNNGKITKKGDTSYVLDRKNRMKLKRKLKLQIKKLNKIKLNEDALAKKKDLVEFGEVAHQPPQLSRRPRGCIVEKPGCKQLLLKNIFSNKNKSMSEIKQLTEEREKVLKAYEAMKLKNKFYVKHK